MNGAGAPLLLLLAGGLMTGFSTGRWLAPLAAWIGPALIMRYARDHPVRRGYPIVIVSLMAAVAIGFWQVWPPLESTAIAVGYGFLLSLPYLADRLAAPWLPGVSSTMVYPLAATTLEAINNHVNPLGAWGMTGFSQYGVLPLMQRTSVTGMLGITFLMGWFAAVANWAWERRTEAAGFRRGLVAFGARTGRLLRCDGSNDGRPGPDASRHDALPGARTLARVARADWSARRGGLGMASAPHRAGSPPVSMTRRAPGRRGVLRGPFSRSGS
jgi:apolipoprotein N-acyltransferase